MADQVAICNLALGRISQRPIIAIDENSVQSEILSRVWLPCLKECLRSNNWSFAQVIEAAALLTYTPLNWSYAYAYPKSASAIWKVYNSGTIKGKTELFRVVFVPALNQKVILTNTAQAYIEYTFDVEDPEIFDPQFVSVLAYRLAAEAAMPLNASEEQAISMTKLYTNQLSEAQRESSYENSPVSGQSPTMFVDARSNAGEESVSIANVTFDEFNRGQT